MAEKKKKQQDEERQVPKKLLAKLEEAAELKKTGRELIKEGIVMRHQAQHEVHDLFEGVDFEKYAGTKINTVTGVATLVSEKPHHQALSDVLHSLRKLLGDAPL